MLRAWSNELLVVIATIVMFGVQPVHVQAETAAKLTSNRPCDLGKHSEDIENARQSLEFVERSLGNNDLATLKAVYELASLYRLQGCYTEAEPLYKRIFDTREKLLGKEHRETLTGMSDLAMIYTSETRYEEAETLLNHALETQKRVLGEEHPDTLSTINNLGMLQLSRGLIEKAEPLLRNALMTSERILGKEHPDTLQRFNNLVGFYKNYGRNAEANELVKIFYKVTTNHSTETRRLQKAILGCWENSDRLSKSINSDLSCFNSKGIVNGVTFDDGEGWDWSRDYFVVNSSVFVNNYFWARIKKADKHQLTLEINNKIYIYKFICRTKKQDIQCERLKYKPDH